MIGQHPELFGIPETHLWLAETVGEHLDRWQTVSFNMGDGLLRAVAQLVFDSQDDRTICLAHDWLSSRAAMTTSALFRTLAQAAAPRTLVEKSPSVVYSS